MTDPREALDNLDKHMVEDILAATDEEIEAELIEDGLDPDEVAAKGKRLLAKAIEESAQRRGSS